VLSFQRCHQQLINGPNYKFRQKRLLFSAEPLVDNQAALLRGKGRLSYPGIRFIQLRRAVGQTNCMRDVLRLGFRPLHQPWENTVGGGLRRQPEIQTAAAALRGKDFCSTQGGLRLPNAHLGFQQNHSGIGRIGGLLQHGPLHVVGQKTETLPKSVRLHTEARALPALRQRKFFPRARSPDVFRRLRPETLH